MNKPILYLSQSTCSQSAAPEYFQQTLSVKISFPKGIKINHDLSLRVFNNQLRMMGCESLSVVSGSTVRQCRLELHSLHAWHKGTYYFYLYRDSRAEWYKELIVLENESGKVPEKMLEISHMAKELFFAENVCTSQWWQSLVNLSYNRMALSELIHRFHYFELARNGGQWKSSPVLFVTSSKPREAEIFATQVLAYFIAHDDKKHCLHLSLQKTVTENISWHMLRQQIGKSRVTTVRLDNGSFNLRSQEIVKRLLNLAYTYQMPEIPLVFYGTRNEMMLMEIDITEITWTTEMDNVFDLDDYEKLRNLENLNDSCEKGCKKEISTDDNIVSCNCERYTPDKKVNVEKENCRRDDNMSTEADNRKGGDFDKILDDFISRQLTTEENVG